MQDINNWLRSEVADLLREIPTADEKTHMKAEAKHLGTAGINAGYTNEQIKEACGGDIETYLLQERGRSLSERLKLDMQRDKYSG